MSSVSDTSSARYAEQQRYEAAELERRRMQEAHQEQINDLKEDFAEDKKSSQEEYNTRLMEEKREAAEEVRKLKEEMYNNEGKKFAKDSRDISDQKSQLENYQEQVKKEYQDRTERMEHSFNNRLKDAETRKQEQIYENMEHQNKSHQLETKHLRDSLKQATVDPRDLDVERASARAESIRQVEGQSNREKAYLVSAYENNIQRMKDNDEQMRDDHVRRMTEHQYEMTAKTNQMLREQKRDFNKRDEQRVAELKQINSDFDRNIRNLKADSDRHSTVLNQNNERQTQSALENQARTLGKYHGDKNAELNYELQESQKEAKLLKTTDNTMLASPALVNRIQKSEEERYWKQLQAEHNHNQNQLDGMKERDITERRELKGNFDREIAESHRENTRKLDRDRNMLLTSYDDLQYSKDQEAQNLRDSHRAIIERNHIKHAQEMDFQERKNLESLKAQRDNFSDNSRQQIDEVKFENKVQGREWAARLSTQQREHNNQLADQALAHESQMNELRLEMDAKLRDQERKSNQMLEERIKSYEQRLKEQELANKDRERFLTERYEEEIAKMKRTNARLIQKKS